MVQKIYEVYILFNRGIEKGIENLTNTKWFKKPS